MTALPLVRTRVVPKLCRSIASTSAQLPSSRYLQRADTQHRVDTATHETPKSLTKEQRDMLHAAIRIDQAGEVAANWIYKGQLAILGRDPKTGPIIEVFDSYFVSLSSFLTWLIGNVGTGEETFGCHESTTNTT